MRYFVLILLKILLALCLIPLALHAMDYPAEFAQNMGGNLAADELPGFASTPARTGASGFGMAFACVHEADICVAGLSGEFGFESPLNLESRIAFLSSYMEMDSVYRRVYSELDFSLYRSWFILGVGYGNSVEWIPDEQDWMRHRYKVGATLVWRGVSFSVAASRWGDNWNESWIDAFDYSLGAHVSALDRFGAFVEWDGKSLDVGNSVRFKYVQVRSVYRFPSFGVALSLDFLFGGWSVGVVYGFTESIWDWFGFSVSKKN